jgi:hypothetical protein
VALPGRLPENFSQEQMGHLARMALGSYDQDAGRVLLASPDHNESDGVQDILTTDPDGQS